MRSLSLSLIVLLCASFEVSRGIRQGCSLSGMLYYLVIQPLLQTIRKNLDGFRIPLCDVNFCISAYADDLIIINKQSDIYVLSKLIEDFGKWSSAKVNCKKVGHFY